MNTPSRKSLASVVLSGVVGLGLVAGAGCAAKQGGTHLPQSRQHASDNDTSFAAGAGRAPTAETSYAFAKILIGQGRDRDALYVLSRVIREHARFLPAYNEMAGVYVRADRLDDAISVLDTGLKTAPKDGVLQNNLGMCYMLRGEHAKALEAFTVATTSMPSNPTFRADRAAALALTGRDAEAQAEYRTVIGELATERNLNVLAEAREKQKSADAPHNGAVQEHKTEGKPLPAPTVAAPQPATAAPAPLIETTETPLPAFESNPIGEMDADFEGDIASLPAQTPVVNEHDASVTAPSFEIDDEHDPLVEPAAEEAAPVAVSPDADADDAPMANDASVESAVEDNEGGIRPASNERDSASIDAQYEGESDGTPSARVTDQQDDTFELE